MLVNPTFEGLSVVAKEAVFVGDGSHVLLSTTAGAYEQLGSTTVALDPFDVVGTTDALEAALTGQSKVDLADRGTLARAHPLRDRGGLARDRDEQWTGPMKPTSTLTSRIAGSLPVAVGMATRYSLDAAREISIEANRPVMVIASRRQVEADELGGGYVGLDTGRWASDAAASTGSLIVARDHGGLYQHPADHAGATDEGEVTERALESFRNDILSGVELLHIDTSLGQHGAQPPEVARRQAVALVDECQAQAAALGRHVAFELGFEQQDETISSADEFRSWVSPLLSELGRRQGTETAFVVAQTGTKVMDGCNTGALNRDSAGAVEASQLRRLAGMISDLGCRLKAHNCDYLNGSAITTLRTSGAWMNISPELGSAQVRAVLQAARSARADATVDHFCEAAIDAGYWRKWVTSPDVCPDATKVRLGGSYLFATDAFDELRERLDFALGEDHTRRVAIDAAKAVIRRFC